MSRRAVLVVDDPDVRVHFPDIGGSWGGLTMDAFVGLTGGPAMADRGIHEAEVRVIERVAGRIFEIATSGHCAWGPAMAKRSSQHPPEPAGAAATLPSLAPRALLFDMHDWLLRVALVDGVFAHAEQHYLRAAAEVLGIPDNEYGDLAARNLAPLPSQVALTPPVRMAPLASHEHERCRFCAECGYPRFIGVAFCVLGGTDLRVELVQFCGAGTLPQYCESCWISLRNGAC